MVGRLRTFGGAAVLLIALPVLVTAMPPLLDYPNHLTRFWLLSGGLEQAPLARFYAIDWGHTASNIVMDVIAAAVGVCAGAMAAGHVVLLLSALLPPIGAALISRQLYNRVSFWQIWSGLVAWPLVLLTGFMSLELAYGAALMAAWLDLRMSGQSWLARLARQSAQVLLLLLIHPFGAMFYGIVAFAIDLGPNLRASFNRNTWVTTCRSLVSLVPPFVIGAGLLGLRIVLFRQGDDAGLGWPRLSWYDPPLSQMGIDHVFWAFIGPLRSYRLDIDLAFIALLWLPVLVAAALRRLSAHGGLVLIGLGLFAFSLVCPQGIGDTSMVDVRLWTMALLILPMAVLPRLDDEARAYNLLCTLALMVLAARAAWLTSVWQFRQADVRSLEQAISVIPAGARVMPLAADEGDETPPLGRELGDMTPTWSHLDALIVMRRHAYVPTLFAEAGKQPLSVLPPFDEDNEASGGLLATPDDLRAGRSDTAAYLPHWRQEFDYIVLLNAKHAAETALPGTHLIRDEGFARVYRIEP